MKQRFKNVDVVVSKGKPEGRCKPRRSRRSEVEVDAERMTVSLAAVRAFVRDHEDFPDESTVTVVTRGGYDYLYGGSPEHIAAVRVIEWV